jgi:Xaa-Pro aminopeptidase
MSEEYSRKSCSIASEIIKKAISNLRKHKFKTELDVANFLKKETKEHNCNLAFKPIVAIGKNAAEIHHRPNSTKLTKGFLVIDFGVKYKGICSDCTRTVYIGNPTKKEKDLYNLVLSAQLTAINNAKAGEYAANVDLIARAALWDYYKHFVHGTGHGVGKKIHQGPNLKPRGKLILREGNILTVEPGLYFKNRLGIRIEDTMLIKKGKPEILTKINKRLIRV